MIVFDGRLWVHYGQAYVMSGDAPHPGGDLDACFNDQHNGLAGASVPGVLFLTTGLHTGDVKFSIEVSESEPPVDESWADVVEVSFTPQPGLTVLRDWNGVVQCQIPLRPASYRVRYSANRMDEANEADTILEGDDPIDSYQLAFWPAPPRHDQIVKQTSQIATYWHTQGAV